jgi:hypothetical protein
VERQDALLMTRVLLPVRFTASQRHSFVLNCYFCKGLHSFVSAASKPAASTSYEISLGLLNIFVFPVDDSLFILADFVQIK